MSDITTNVVVANALQLFTASRSFKALANGRIYVGNPDTDPTIPSNQKTVYLQNEDGTSVPIPQPIVINAGGHVVYGGQLIRKLTTDGNYSMAIYDAYGSQEYYFEDMSKLDPEAILSTLIGDDGASVVGWKRSPLNKAIDNVHKMLDSQNVNVWEFASLITVKPDASKPETWDWTPAFQAAVNYVTSVSGGVITIPGNKTYSISGVINLPREGIVIDMYGATINGSSGTFLFSRDYPQLTISAFKASYQPVDVEGVLYFRTIVINGGRINLTNGTTGINIRQPWLGENGNCRKTLIMNDLDIVVNDTSVAFGIHGGWGFDFTSCSITGLQSYNIGSGTCLKMLPDGTNSASSHPQAIHFTNCNIQYTTLLNSARGLCTNSCEALYFTNCNCTFIGGGVLDTPNLFEMRGGIFADTIGELIINRAAGVIIGEIQLQRYIAPKTSPRYGTITFIGGGNNITVNNIRALSSGTDLPGSVIHIQASAGSTYNSVSFSNIQYGSTITNLDEADRNKQSAVIRADVASTGYVLGLSCNNIQAAGVHNIVDFAQETAGNVRNVNMQNIQNVGSNPSASAITVKRRVFGLAGCVAINAPEMYEAMSVKMKAVSIGATAVGISYANVKTDVKGLTNTNASSVVTISSTNVSNTTGVTLNSVDASGLLVLVLNQVAALAANTVVEAHATVTVDCSGIPTPQA